MVSRNNLQEKRRKVEARRERHSIRKFSVGAASVLIGFAFLGINKQTVRADEMNAAEVVAIQNDTAETETVASNSRYATSQDKVNGINGSINNDLENAASEASKVDGVTVNQKDPNKVNTTVGEIDQKKEEINQNNQAQIADINDKVNKHKEELDKYNKARDEYIQKLKDMGLWNDNEHIDPDTLSQLLILGKEDNAVVDAESLSDKVTKGEGSILNGLLNNYWKVAESIQGDFLKVTYTNLSNSFYAGKQISKIVITFSDFDKIAGKSGIYFGNSPTDGFFYNKCTGVTMNMELFDAAGNLIILGDNTAYITVGSLNSKGTGSNYIEMAQLLGNGKGIALPESSVTVHPGNILYSDKNNELLYKKNPSDSDRAEAIKIWGEEIVNKYLGWDDSNDRSHEIFGSGLFQVSGGNIKIRFSNQLGSAWATYSTTVPKLAFEQKKPTLTIEYTPGELVLNKNSNVHIHYIDVTSEANKGTTEFVPEHGTELEEQLQSIKHLAVGDTYTNQLWAWETAGYQLATKEPHPSTTTGTILDDDQHFYVYLKKKIDQPVIPDQPTTPQPTDPQPTQPTVPEDQPTNPTTPDQPTAPQPTQPLAPTDTVIPKPELPVDPVEDEAVKPKAETAAPEEKNNQSVASKKVEEVIAENLPETGETKKANTGVIGLALAGLASLIGLAGNKKRKKK